MPHFIHKRYVFYNPNYLKLKTKVWGFYFESNTLATWCEELTPCKGPWCWERLRGGVEEDDRGWDGWMTSLTQWTWMSLSKLWGLVMDREWGRKEFGHNWETELTDGTCEESILENSGMCVIRLGLPGAFLMQKPPSVQKMWVWSLGWEDPLEEMTTHSYSCLGIPWTEEPARLQSMVTKGLDMT